MLPRGSSGASKAPFNLSELFQEYLKTSWKLKTSLFYFIIFLNAEILVPGDVLEVLKMSFVKSLITVPPNSWSCGVPCGLFLVNFWWWSSCLCLCSVRERGLSFNKNNTATTLKVFWRSWKVTNAVFVSSVIDLGVVVDRSGPDFKIDTTGCSYQILYFLALEHTFSNLSRKIPSYFPSSLTESISAFT